MATNKACPGSSGKGCLAARAPINIIIGDVAWPRIQRRDLSIRLCRARRVQAERVKKSRKLSRGMTSLTGTDTHETPLAHARRRLGGPRVVPCSTPEEASIMIESSIEVPNRIGWTWGGYSGRGLGLENITLRVREGKIGRHFQMTYVQLTEPRGDISSRR